MRNHPQRAANAISSAPWLQCAWPGLPTDRCRDDYGPNTPEGAILHEPDAAVLGGIEFRQGSKEATNAFGTICSRSVDVTGKDRRRANRLRGEQHLTLRPLILRCAWSSAKTVSRLQAILHDASAQLEDTVNVFCVGESTAEGRTRLRGSCRDVSGQSSNVRSMISC